MELSNGRPLLPNRLEVAPSSTAEGYLTRLSVRTQLLLAYGAVVSITVALGILSLDRIHSLRASLQRVVDQDARKAVLASRIDSLLGDQAGHQRGVAIRAVMKDPVGVQRYTEQLRASMREITQRIAEIEPLVYSAQGHSLLAALQAGVRPLPDLQSRLYSLAEAGDPAPLLNYQRDQLLPPTLAARQVAVRLVQYQEELMAASRHRADEEILHSQWIIAGALLTTLVAGAVVVFLIRRLNQRLQRVTVDLLEGSRQTAAAASQIAEASHALA